ncbi:MAG TPA: MFS transporter [Armatimonadota bacterium]|nr:MFS transporter [Armatimonadota bacterium]
MAEEPRPQAAEPIPPPESERLVSPWGRTLGALLIAQFLSISGFWMVQPFLPFYIKELGVRTPTDLAIWSGVIMGSMSFSFAVFAPLWGSMADRYGRKPMVARAMFGGVVTLTLMGLSRSVHELLALRLMQGALTGSVTATNAMVSSIVPRQRIGVSLGMNQMMVILGSSLGPWLGGYLIELWGYRMSFFVAAGLVLIAGLVALFGAQEEFDRSGNGAAGGGQGLRQAFGGKGMIALLVVFFVVAFSSSFGSPVFPLLVEAVVGEARAASATGTLLGASGLMAGVAAVIVGRLGDRAGYQRLLAGATLISGLVTMPHALVQTMGQLLPLRIAMGGATGGIQPSLNAFITSAVSPDMIGRAYGVTRCAHAIGMAAGPIVCGLIASWLGVRMPFVVMGVLLMISSMMLTRLAPSAGGGGDRPSGEALDGEATD